MMTSRWHVLVCTLIGLVGATSAWAIDQPARDTARKSGMESDAQCTACHNEGWRVPVLSIYQTRHGNRADPRAPTCQGCHGTSEAHRSDPAGKAPEVVFAAKSKRASSPDDSNNACLSCHKSDPKRSHWMGSTHQNTDVTCSTCHSVHSAQDPVRMKTAQADVCYSCHKEQRTMMAKPSHHPVPEGKMTCSDCHNPHGSVGPKLVKRDSVNETCYLCHTEKRGPFVHTHEPVAEDCGNCHNPHGTTQESMLKMRPPMLCHQCHTPHGGQVLQLLGQGQTTSMIGPNTSGKQGVNYTMARGCLNCHTQVHGTNNPNATNPTPQFNFR